MGKVKILIVEDDSILQKLYDEGLPEAEYEKRFSENGIDALESYKEWAPDIVILDIGLPEMDGYNVLIKIRKEMKDNDTTIIMATGVDDKRKMNDCIMLGISSYIVKPFRYEDINEIVMRAYKEGQFYLKI